MTKLWPFDLQREGLVVVVVVCVRAPVCNVHLHASVCVCVCLGVSVSVWVVSVRDQQTFDQVAESKDKWVSASWAHAGALVRETSSA